MKSSFIVVGALLTLWGIASFVVALQDMDGGIAVRPRQEAGYAVAFLASGAVLVLAGIKKYALNGKFVLGVAFLHAAVYLGGTVVEGACRSEPVVPGVIASGALLLGALISFRAAHGAHRDGSK